MIDKEKLMKRFWKQLAKACDEGRGTYMNADIVFEVATFFHEQTNEFRKDQPNDER